MLTNSEKIQTQLEEAQKHLNASSVVSPSYYVPNYLEFRKLVCINHITGCYLSKNFDPIPSLIELARSELQQQLEVEGYEAFSKVATAYLALMEKYLEFQSIERRET